MNISRIYQNAVLTDNAEIQLDERGYHYVSRVLRANINDALVIFNGQGGEYPAIISSIDKKKLLVKLGKLNSRECESPLELSLAQGISRGEKMDFTIQKAVELGVKKIIPLVTERCNVKLDADRQEKKWQHWQSIVISACEQSGRNKIPIVSVPQTLEQWLQTVTDDFRFVLSPEATEKLSARNIPTAASAVLLIGPEGGLSDGEIKKAIAYQFLPLKLGPRILRTETAPLAAIAVLQALLGDL